MELIHLVAHMGHFFHRRSIGFFCLGEAIAKRFSGSRPCRIRQQIKLVLIMSLLITEQHLSLVVGVLLLFFEEVPLDQLS